jgi:hypothetical protein
LLGEIFLDPNSMMYRMWSVVLIGGCEDRAGPTHGRSLSRLSAIQHFTGRMMTGRHKGEGWTPARITVASGRSIGRFF